MTSPDYYPLENTPNIEGLLSRHFAGESDYLKMLAIFTNLHAAGQYSGETTIESLRADYSNLSNTDPQDDLIFFEIDSKTVAFCRFYWERQVKTGQYTYGINVRVDPSWQGKGIEQSLIAWGETRGRYYASVLPEGNNGAIVTFCRETDQMKYNILMEAGFTIDRYFHSMSRPLIDLPERSLPEGITVRPVLPKDFRKIWDASNEAFMDEYGAADPTEEWYQSYLASPNFQPYLWQVAWDGDEVVGSVQNYISLQENELEDRRRGYTEGISVRREWRGRGVASALICRSMAMFKAMNMDEVTLTADTQNPTGAMRLYTNLGYQPYLTLLELKKSLECLNS
jgi:ribosomal protein S18 acetylase RimI-like enzyme